MEDLEKQRQVLLMKKNVSEQYENADRQKLSMEQINRIRQRQYVKQMAKPVAEDPMSSDSADSTAKIIEVKARTAGNSPSQIQIRPRKISINSQVPLPDLKESNSARYIEKGSKLKKKNQAILNNYQSLLKNDDEEDDSYLLKPQRQHHSFSKIGIKSRAE